MSRNRLGSMMLLVALLVGGPTAADQLPPDASYRPLPTLPFEQTKASDEAQKPQVMQRQEQLLNQRYDLSDQPVSGVMMSGGRRAVQGGVRVKLSQGVTWSSLAEMSPQEVRDILISYFEEHHDARETAKWVEKAGKRAVVIAGDVSQEEHCQALVKRTITEFGKIDLLVNNAAIQRTHQSIEEISSEE
jgi:Cft2 family RNA processing exonuclease